MIQTFEIKGRLPGANEQRDADKKNRPKLHYFPGNDLKRNTQEMIEWSIAAAHIRPIARPVMVHFTWIEPNMRRDKDNICFGQKYIMDALVEKGVLVDDGWKFVVGYSHRFLVNKNDPRVIVELEEI